ncbi:DNA-binding transcriptional regulator, LysR family [Sporobacter termitidis DSM 10068]|uniref:DNA-binding transcriptional regulator, LysR family n=1 Tax=Sporobacter termitidis DSM 10068 TaxID=1123282 RepID=A0A1M5XTM0_9FIRM|nr:LysR family transcriptional regulator [Sporobacter termitidis]SHI02884.1 DNA-binding transcriptional regulator, LysR family [Sporobacter termitidis DSM 10068]
MINVTFQQVDAFLAVAEHLNIADTANMLYSSQSALSKTITRFEGAVGVRLFERGNRGVALTKEGQYLYDRLRRPFDVVVNAFGEVQDMYRQPRQRLRIGCPDTYNCNPVYNIVKMAISNFMERYPNVEVSETIYEHEQLKAALIFSDVDLVVGPSFVIRDLKDASTMKLALLEAYFTVSANHPLAQADALDVKRLADLTFYEVLIGSSDAVEKHVFKVCANLGFTPKAVRFVPNMLSLIRTIGIGKGVSISGRIDSAAYDVSIRYYPIPKYPGFVESHIMAAWLPDRTTAEKRDFLCILRGLAQDQL